MRQSGMLVVCVTDIEAGYKAVFEVADRRQATATRKLLYSLLPPDCHSSIRAWPETKQHYLDRVEAISPRTGPPVRWFELGDRLPERFENLRIAPEVLQAYLEERREQERSKPLSYWGTPVQRLKMLNRH